MNKLLLWNNDKFFARKITFSANVFHGIYCFLTFILYINDWFKRFFVTREFLELSDRGGVFCYEWRCILSIYFNDEKIQQGEYNGKMYQGWNFCHIELIFWCNIGALLSLLKYKGHIVMEMFSLHNQSISESFALEKLTGNGAITYPHGPNRIISIWGIVVVTFESIVKTNCTPLAQ